ncbi:hypothetical protein WMY93_016913 [Mugilogobius chulae]|uniref:Uncharacterized protein n=1 Tax=Mugilogobius chulae TaxID=88201 RepID=A0AAW0NM50_9GOBI
MDSRVVSPGQWFDASLTPQDPSEQKPSASPVLGLSSELFVPTQSVSRRSALERKAEKVCPTESSPDSLDSLSLCPDSDRPPPNRSRHAIIPDLVQTQTSSSPQTSALTTNHPSAAAHDSPLLIHGYTVEEYQHRYHSVVDDMLVYSNGRPRPYSLALGRKIKQRLWEKLNRPLVSVVGSVVTSFGELLQFDQVSAKGPFPPLIDVDISGEPTPGKPYHPKKGLQTEQIEPTVSAPVQIEPTVSAPVQIEPTVSAADATQLDCPRKQNSTPPMMGMSSEPFVLPKTVSRRTLKRKVEKPRSSSPEPEEPHCKRPFQALAASQSQEEPLSQSSLVLKFTQVQRRRQPTYRVQNVSKPDQKPSPPVPSICSEPFVPTKSISRRTLGLKRKAEKFWSPSPESEEESHCKRPFQALAASQSPEEPKTALVLKFTKVHNKKRKSSYSVEDVSKPDQVQTSALETSNAALDFPRLLGLAPTRPHTGTTSHSSSPHLRRFSRKTPMSS